MIFREKGDVTLGAPALEIHPRNYAKAENGPTERQKFDCPAVASSCVLYTSEDTSHLNESKHIQKVLYQYPRLRRSYPSRIDYRHASPLIRIIDSYIVRTPIYAEQVGRVTFVCFFLGSGKRLYSRRSFSRLHPRLYYSSLRRRDEDARDSAF